MKRYINAFLSLAAVASLSLGSCSRENPFSEGDSMMGAFRTSSLDVNVNTEENVVRAQADDAPSLSSFTVAFYKDGETTPHISYRYEEMPEIVTLPVGTYSAVAYSGDNEGAAFSAPYYRGESESFEIVADVVSEVSEPVVCRLSNVKVSVFFDDDLSAAMSADSKVTVSVGEHGGSLVFTKADEGRHGYFAYLENSSSLAAYFEGNVEDYPTSVSKSRDDVQPGNHYILTFSLRSAGEEEPGTLAPSIGVDASVTVEDVDGNVVTEDEYLEDDMRPSEGEEPQPPTPPADENNGPTVKATEDSGIDMDEINDFYEGVVCKLLITSDAPDGITEFTVNIDSPTLTPDVLEDVYLSSNLDLINPGELEDALKNLGFPVGSEVKNQHEVLFDISGFGGLLGMLGAGEHKFILTVADSNGTTVKTLRLRTL